MKPSEITPEQFEFCKQSNYMVDKEPKKKKCFCVRVCKEYASTPTGSV